jgi:hypothetical protein
VGKREKEKAETEEQLRGKEGATCFAVSLTPAIIQNQNHHHEKERECGCSSSCAHNWPFALRRAYEELSS